GTGRGGRVGGTGVPTGPGARAARAASGGGGLLLLDSLLPRRAGGACCHISHGCGNRPGALHDGASVVRLTGVTENSKPTLNQNSKINVVKVLVTRANRAEHGSDAERLFVSVPTKSGGAAQGAQVRRSLDFRLET